MSSELMEPASGLFEPLLLAQSLDLSQFRVANWDCLCGGLPGGFGPLNPDLSVTTCFLFTVLFNVANLIAVIGGLYELYTFRGKTRMSLGPSLKAKFTQFLIAVQFVLFLYLAIRAQTPVVTVSTGISAAVVAHVALVSYYGRLYSIIASPSLLLYYPASALCLLLAASQAKSHLLAALAVNAILLFILELIPRSRSIYEEYMDPKHNNPYDLANIYSRLSFAWMTPLMKKGYETFLTADDLPDLAAADLTEHCTPAFQIQWEKEVDKGNPRLFVALFKTFGGRYVIGGLFKLCQDAMSFAQPQLLRLLISFMQEYTDSDGDVPLTKGIYIAIGMFLVSILQTAFLHQYFDRAFGTGMRVRSALTNSIYQKALVLSNEERSNKATGDIVNLMSIDTQRLQDVFPNGNVIWSGPFQIVLCLVSLYNLLGNAMWAGVVVMIITIPINSILANIQKKMMKVQMKRKDQRTKLTNELLSSMKSIKLYAWEEPFSERLRHVRNELELGNLKKLTAFSSSTMFLWSFSPFLVSLATFALYTMINDDPLTTDKVFPAIALFNLLTFPMAMFPMLITSVIEARVASERVKNFLISEDLQRDAVVHSSRREQIGEAAIELKDATFLWKREPRIPAVKNLSFEAKKGELTCVVGRVGSGKSALISAILGNTTREKGNAIVHGSVAYVSQSPWIFNGSVQENILFGLRYDENIYNETIQACSLIDDLDALPDGDSTMVGEKGISLSGGQKARISLARAVYARADVYLLDDPLSAVDEHVGRHIIDNILSSTGLLATKTIVLATNSIPVLKHAHVIAMISQGEIIQQGPLHAVVNDGPIAALLKEFGHKDKRSESRQSTVAPSSSETSSVNEEEVVQLTQDAPERKARDRRASLRRPSVASFNVTGPAETRKEHMEQGKVSWNVYREYAKVAGLPMIFLFIGVMIVANAFGVVGNVWLKHWSEVNTDQHANVSVFFFLGIYFVFGLGQGGLNVIQNMLMYLGASIPAAAALHDRMLAAVMRAPMTFFETTPLGRVLNRFSNDVYRVDQNLARSFYQVFNQITRVCYTVAVIAFGTPGFLVFVLPLVFVYYYYQRYYLRTSRELKRLESVSKSPVFAQFQETLDGMSTVRAYGQENRFNFVNESYINGNNKAYFPSISANRWLAIRLEFIGSILILAAAVLAVVTLPTGQISAGMAGLALSYALNITQSLGWIVRMTVEVETNIVSVERMLEYADLPSEAPAVIEDKRPAEHWPSEGRVAVNNYSCRYREGLPLVLKNINLDIKPREKIGIVGRTGAGKSSLTLALFRIIEAAEGNISIDEVTTSDIGLHDLRSHLSIIPQDSQLFEGTIRDNLDPNEQQTDEALWRVLKLAHLQDFVESLEGGLEARVAEGGSNISNGQQQLVCLARAMLTDSRILVLDEATAAVDVETDKILQQTIREEFKDRTILTIAHRINTIMDSDRVVVLSFGQVVEFDTPGTLLENPDSLFYKLAKQGGLVE